MPKLIVLQEFAAAITTLAKEAESSPESLTSWEIAQRFIQEEPAVIEPFELEWKIEKVTSTLKALLLHILQLNVQTVALVKVLRDHGISMDEIGAAAAWAGRETKEARAAIERLGSEASVQAVADILRDFQGPLQ